MRLLRALRRAATSPLTTWSVAAWSWRSAHRLGPKLDAIGIDAIAEAPPSPDAPAAQRTTVSFVLRLTRTSCLVRSAVLQRWDSDHGRPRPLIIGVAKSGNAVDAHAWLEGEPAGEFVEIHRRAATFRA